MRKLDLNRESEWAERGRAERMRASWPNNGVSPFYGDPLYLEHTSPARRERNRARGIAKRGNA